VRVLVGVIALVLLGGGAGAAPPAGGGNAGAEATAHFNKGDEHFNKGEYREAYDEYRQSMSFKKTKAAMVNAASCLRQLGRYDEALEQYEELRREFPSLPAKFEEKVAPAMLELQGLVGTLILAGDAPPGAVLFVDDRLRGKLPLEKPLRISVGSHGVRVEKDGFDPIAGTVEVKAGQENVAQLQARVKKGRLVVSEKHNWALNVEVDGKDVGVTPWKALVDPGEHQVRLHGYMGVEALAACEAPSVKPEERAAAQKGTKMASKVATAIVEVYAEKEVVLGAEEQDAPLRVESTPSGASVRIDSKEMGRTPWEGRLPLGGHGIEVSAGGFFPVEQRVKLERRKQQGLAVVLEREPDTAGLRRARSAGLGVAYGVGALGLGVFAVSGVLALVKMKDVSSRCNGAVCRPSEQGGLDAVHALGRTATAGLVIGGVGVATGTIILLAVRPGADRRPQPAGGVAFRAGVAGLGRFNLEGSF
jgi:hypothetical protein